MLRCCSQFSDVQHPIEVGSEGLARSSSELVHELLPPPIVLARLARPCRKEEARALEVTLACSGVFANQKTTTASSTKTHCTARAVMGGLGRALCSVNQLWVLLHTGKQAWAHKITLPSPWFMVNAHR